MERTIKGKVKKWSEITAGFKADKKTPWAKTSCQVEGSEDWHGFFGGNPEELEAFITSAPIGSEVEFIEWQKEGDEYWNYKQKTFKVASIGSGADEQLIRTNHVNRSIEEAVTEMEQKEARRQDSIIKQTCLKAAAEIVASYPKDWKSADSEVKETALMVLKLAKMFHAWVIDKQESI